MKDRNEEVFNKAELIVAKQRNGPTGKIELYFDDKFTKFLGIEKCIKLKSLMKFIENIGGVFSIFFSNLGKFILFIIFFFKYLFNPKFYLKIT